MSHRRQFAILFTVLCFVFPSTKCQSFLDGTLDEFVFESNVYTGTYDRDNVTFEENIKLLGYEDDVYFEFEGENSEYFNVTNDRDEIEIILEVPIPDIRELSYIIFTMFAMRPNGQRAQTAIHIPLRGTFIGNCEIEGMLQSQWSNLTIDILDTHRGTTFLRATKNILGISSFTQKECETNEESYITSRYFNGTLTIGLDSKFASFEANEDTNTITNVITFDCDVGVRRLTIFHRIRDTNNNAPTFLPTNEYNYTVTLPLLAGQAINTAIDDIVVRDIDLTTYIVTPNVEPNDYFEIVFREMGCMRKDYKMQLRTKRVIASLPQPLQLTIIAQDRDNTGFPSITSFGTLKISVRNTTITTNVPQFERPMYRGVIDTASGIVSFSEEVALSSGFVENVIFSLHGDGAEGFNIALRGNVVQLTSNGDFQSHSGYVFTLSATDDEELFHGRTTLQIN